jgi:hypothetical protein
MTRTQIIAASYGVAVCGLGAWLDSHGHDTSSQVVMISMVAMAAPVGLAVMVKGVRQAWFWTALTCCAILHLSFITWLWSRLPLERGDNAILIAIGEMFVLLLVSAKIMDSHPSGRAAAELFAGRRKGRKPQ